MDELPVKSMRTTFRILETLAEQNGAGISELGVRLDVPNSTVHDHLTSLVKLGYVVKRDGSYYLAMEMLRVGNVALLQNELYHSAESEMARLASETNEHVSLAIEEHGKAVLIGTEEGAEAISVPIYNGIRMHMHTAAAGKAILAYLPAERRDEILDEYGLPQITEHTVTDRTELEAELETVRERKYALDDEGRLAGMRSVGVPIVDRHTEIQGALTIYGPTNRVTDELFYDEFPELLLEAGNIVEVLLNYN